jgi:hypothetical protein
MTSLEQIAQKAVTANIIALPPYAQEEILGISYQTMLAQAKEEAKIFTDRKIKEAIKKNLADLESIIPDLVSELCETSHGGLIPVKILPDNVSADTLISAGVIADLIMQELSIAREPPPALAMWGIDQDDCYSEDIDSEEEDGYDSF